MKRESMRSTVQFALGIVLMLLALRAFPAENSAVIAEGEKRDLKEVQIVSAEYLKRCSCVSMSADGKFLYAAASTGFVSIFQRDGQTGQITNQSWFQMPEFSWAVSIRLSPDNRYAVSAAAGSKSPVLFERDRESGNLEMLNATGDVDDSKFDMTSLAEGVMSGDNQFIYAGSSAGVAVLKCENGRIVPLGGASAHGMLRGVRSIVLSADETMLYATAVSTNSLGVFRRDIKTGKLEAVQILTDGQEGFRGLGGVFRIARSADGKHLYSCSGRMGGDNAISAFEVLADGKLKLIEEHINGENGFTDFEGGNTIAVSPDGKYVFASATNSDRIARFRRNVETGRLTFLGSQVVGPMVRLGAHGVCFSPDGRFVYIADHDSNSIVVLQLPSL
jgi:6-phosphogluconolactonase (cycloisomerase 2 family)